MNTINEVPQATTANLLREFPANLPARSRISRAVTIGIEVEVPWKAYFPDLWMDGFPNVGHEDLVRITTECNRREKTLIPLLMKTQECGIKRGADRYWEFAFDPVTDVSIACDHVEILRQHNLIPEGRHSLHITFGGVRVSKEMYYVAMCLEAIACSPDRVVSGFNPKSPLLSQGWARKGMAGLFEKEGDHDIMHDMQYGTEIRLLWLPDTDAQLFSLLTIAQVMTDNALRVQRGETPTSMWKDVVQQCKQALLDAGLPDRNWKRPNLEPEVWRQFADKLPEIQWHIRQSLQHHFGSLGG